MPRHRLKTPPHGKRIIEARNDGIAVYKVWILYGRDWTLPARAGQPAIVVPADYKPGDYDFSCLTGLQADLVCRRGAADAVTLGIELARYAAPVLVHWVADEDDWPIPEGTKLCMDLLELAPKLDIDGKGAVNMRAGWSPEWELEYADRSQKYEEAIYG